MIDLKQLDKFLVDDFLKDIFIGFLQKLFAQNEGEFRFDPDPAKTNIVITDRFSYSNLTPDFKPVVFTRRRPLGFLNTSVDQLKTVDFTSGGKQYMDLLSGAMELVAVSREGLEAARLAGYVFLLVQEFKSDIRKLGMHDVSVKALGEEEIKKGVSTIEIVEVPVTVQYLFSYSWMTNIMSNTPLADVIISKGKDIVDSDGNKTGICIPMSS